MSEAALAASLESNYSGGFLYNYAHTINESTSLAADWSSWFNQNGPTCSNETALFGQRAHFISCSVYPYISHEISQGNFISSANLSVDLVNNITLAQNITGTISACLQGFCETVSSCEHITECSPTLLMVNNTLLSTEAISLCWTELCSHQSSTVNPDIAGAGVMISYLMQSALAIFAALLLYGFCQYSLMSRWRARKAAKTGPRDTLAQRESSLATRQIQVLVFTLVEFQKAQCFFSMAVQIATLVFILTEQTYYSPTDISALLTVSSMGVVSMLLNLYALMRYGQSSWYIFCLSVCSWALSLAVTFHISFAYPYHKFYWDEPIIYIYPALAPLTLVLVLWQVGIWDCGLVKATRIAYGRLPSFVRNKVFWIIMEHLCILGTFGWAFFLQSELFAMLFRGHVIDTTNWGFGQIVGITYWVPTLVEYAYQQYNGIEEGGDYRYADPVHVTAKPYCTAITPESSCTRACVHNHDVYTPDGSSSARAARSNGGSIYQSLPPEPDIELERRVPHY
ncbi:MAG: hypothetical protein FRX48_06028 [Lasallia pustulata]|uniref:Uncharacterized protein n=1 Tax=Lasallia pustulata TaxID=136370 RepID=A0A5M8PNW4_9LECA|nr:MAG: hypothetical protein FRX48_06028 [Lasallia pustulata]